MPNSPSKLAFDIDARAYFAWNAEVAVQTGDATLEYLVEALGRPSHSAEETYYNLLRVGEAHQMIYKEDRLLRGAVGYSANVDLFARLDAYGAEGHTLISYWGNGWLRPETKRWNPAQVWWLTFAARWSHHINFGVDNLESCARYWNAGRLPGLADIFCQNANDGSAPTQAEVTYARFLLTGDPVPPDAPPRWVLTGTG